MMLGEESEPAKVWEQAGTEALRRGVKRIVIMVYLTSIFRTLSIADATWSGCTLETLGDSIEVSMNPNPKLLPVGGVKDARWLPYKTVPDLAGGEKVIKLLKGAGFNVKPALNFDWIHDTFLIIIRMFPHCLLLPTTIVPMNARYESHFHVKIGATLRPLRYEDTLIIGSGGSVHNLYRNHWKDMMLYKDNFAQPVPPGTWALEFRQAMEDVITNNTGPELRRAITRLMKHPRYKEAHGTDDHWMASLFACGAAGGKDDVGPNILTAECWELVNMCSTQYQLGSWDAYKTMA